MSAPRPYTLDCEHVVWYRHEHAPSPGDPLFCVKCNRETRVISHDPVRGTYYPDGEWMCYRLGSRCRGVCYRDGEGCGYEYTAPFNQLRSRMERHNLRGCDSVDLLDLKVVTLPPNSPPPF